MHRVDTSTAVAVKPAVEAAGDPGYFTKGDPVGGTPATVPGVDWCNMMQEELIAILVAFGVTPDQTKADFGQIATALLANFANINGSAAQHFFSSTPTQFDTGPKVATTTFVKNALGSASAHTVIGGNVTLTAANAGNICYFSAAAVATLPLANTVPAGTVINFVSMTSGATSAARQGADTIEASSVNSALTSMALLDGAARALESNGVDRWTLLNPISAGQLELISSAVANNSASIDFTNISNSRYASYLIVGDNITPSVNGSNLLLRFSQAAVFDAAPSHYVDETLRFTSSVSVVGGAGAGGGATAINVSPAGAPLGTGANQQLFFNMRLCDMANGAFKRVSITGELLDAANAYLHTVQGGQFVANNTDVDGFRFFMDTGAIATGTFNLYGILR